MADPSRQAASGDAFLAGNFPNPQMDASTAPFNSEDKLFDILGLQSSAAETNLDDFLLADLHQAQHYPVPGHVAGTSQHMGAAFLQPPAHATATKEVAQVGPATADVPSSSVYGGAGLSGGAPAEPDAKPSTSSASSVSSDTKPATKSTKKRSTWGARTPDGRRRRKEPKRADYATTEEYLTDWSRWRKIRDSNNRSVKRSREKARERSAMIEAENSRLQKTIDGLRASLKDTKQLAHKALTKPSELSASEVERIKSFANE